MAQSILVLGFSQFPGVPQNPAESLVRKLADEKWAPDPAFSVDYQVLRTSFAAVERYVSVLGEQERYDLILAFGSDARADGFLLERMARNKVSTEKVDEDGTTRSTPVVEKQGSDSLLTNVEVAGLADALNAQGYRCRVSEDAGDYVCNFLYYKLLFSRTNSAKVLFVHIPLEPKEHSAEIRLASGGETSSSTGTPMGGTRVIVSQILEQL